MRGVSVLPDTFNENIYFLPYIYSLAPPMTIPSGFQKPMFPWNKLDPNIRSFSSERMFRIGALNFITLTILTWQNLCF